MESMTCSAPGAAARLDLEEMTARLWLVIAAGRGASMDGIIQARAAEMMSALRAEDAAREEDGIAFEAFVIATAEVALASLRMLLDGEQDVIAMLGEASYARIQRAIREDLRREPLHV